MGFFSKILDKLGFDAGASKVDEMLRTPAAPASKPSLSRILLKKPMLLS